MKLPFLKSRPAQTLLYITEAKTFRIDLDKRGVMLGTLDVLDYRCDTAKSLPNTLELILAKGGAALGKNLWILYAALQTGLVSLPSMQVEGADAEMLEQALLFEFESMTGDNVAQSHLASQFISDADEMSSYWVSLLAKETLTKLLETLKPAACKLKGIAHPAGLPVLMAGDKNESWLRIETFSNAIMALHQTVERELKLHIFSPDLNPNWQDQLDAWIIDTGDVSHSETIMNNRVEYLPPTDESFHLTTEGALDLWMLSWGEYLVNTPEPAVPLIKFESKINYDLVFMLGGGGLALALCLGHFTWNLSQRNTFEYQTEQLSKAEKDIKAARKGVTSSRDAAAKLEKKLATLRKNVKVLPQAIEALQSRPMMLLKILAESTPADLMIESVQLNEANNLMITGISLKPQLINGLARDIKPKLAVLGWEVHTPTKTDLVAFADSGPWEFTLELEDKGLAGFLTK